ncbi:uncharacterized protein LOC136065192 [Quercus suber]|uniref:uncharacterized protein LOC136065192 n=1 Tax=Quercus suber TaxID=58331 RepID=UPI0032DED51B
MGEVSTHMSCDEASTLGTAPSPLAIRWKGAKITTEHPMHVLRAYLCRSLRYGQIRLSGSHTKIIWVRCPHIVRQANAYGGLSCCSYIFGWSKAITQNVFSDS